jgi:hypothetical protein
MLAMMRWSAAAVAAAILGVTLTGCSDRSVSIDEIGELEDLRDAHVTFSPDVFRVGPEEARIGVASGAYLAVVVGDKTPRHVTISGRSYRLVSGCAGAGVYAGAERFRTVAFTLARAMYDRLAPDAYCEG